MSDILNITGPVRLALERLLVSHPLHATLITRWRVVADTSIETMAVQLGRDLRVTLLYNPTFVMSITPLEVEAVLQHEVHHVLLGHLSVPPETYPDATARMLAQEMTCNEYVPEHLPGTPILLAMFPGFPARESTAKRYERLTQGRRPTRTNRRRGLAGAGVCASAPEDIDAVVIQTVVMADIALALGALSPETRKSEVRRLADQFGHQAGTGVAETLIELVEGCRPTTDWRAILRSFAWRLTEPTATLRRPARRFPDLVGIVPGRLRAPNRPNVLAVIDTSGSMLHPSTLKAVRSEVEALGTFADTLIAECDTRVHRTYRLSGTLERLEGGGGTDFREPLQSSFLRANRVDCAIYVTDGYGIAPESPPAVPILWCLIGPWAIRPAPWGRVVRVPTETTNDPQS